MRLPNSVRSALAPVGQSVLDATFRHWAWLAPNSHVSFGLTLMGDWLTMAADGSVVRLDTLEGTLSRIAGSVAELAERLNDEHARDDLLLEGLAIGFLRGRTLKADTYVNFTLPPAIGGKIEVANLALFEVASHQLFLSGLHRALVDVPAHAHVTGVDVDQRGKISVRWTAGSKA